MSSPVADVETTSWGVFAQATYALSDEWSMTLGVRYSEDERDFVAKTRSAQPDGTVVPALAGVPGYDPSLGGIPQSASFDEISYTASLNWQATPDQLLYARTSRGYRGGGFNARVLNVTSVASFDPELITDYELGVKADWFDRSVRTNLAAFYSETEDTQQSTNLTGPDGRITTLIQNQGVRKIFGVEAELAWQITDGLSLNLNATWLDGELINESFDDVDYLPNTPEWAGNIGATYQADFGELVSATFSINGAYRDAMQDTNGLRLVENGAASGPMLYIPEIESHFLVGARTSFVYNPTGLEVSLYGSNLTDEDYNLRVVGLNGTGIVTAVAGAPRIVGMEVKLPF